MSIKIDRIASQITKELSGIIYENVKNEMLKDINITAVHVTPDVSVAKVYYTFLGEHDKDLFAEELKKASGYLRSELAERIEIRHTPELRFQYDESIEYGANIERILGEINNENNL